MMKTIFRLLTLVMAGLLIFSFGTKESTSEEGKLESELALHISEAKDTLVVLSKKLQQLENEYFDSLLNVENAKLASLNESLKSAGIAEIYVAHETCDEIIHWVGMTLGSLSGTSN